MQLEGHEVHGPPDNGVGLPDVCRHSSALFYICPAKALRSLKLDFAQKDQSSSYSDMSGLSAEESASRHDGPWKVGAVCCH